MKNLAVAALALALVAPARASTYSVTTDASSTTLKVNGRLHMQTLAGVDQLVIDSVKGLFTWAYGLSTSSVTVPGTVLTSTTSILAAPVGIGTASPGSPLVVQAVGASGIHAAYLKDNIVTGGSAKFGTIRYSDNATYSAFFDWNASSMGWSAPGQSTENLTITSNGNVGIGTTNPGTTLEVSGAISGGTLPNGEGNFEQPIKATSKTAGQALYIGASSTGGNAVLGPSKTNGDIILTHWNGSANVEDMRDFHGSLGIGTSSPGTLLDVNGAGTIRGSLTVAASSMTVNPASGVYWGVTHDGAGGARLNIQDALGNKIHGDILASPLTLCGAVSCNIGLGTSSPGSTLDVNGEITGRTGLTASSGTFTATGNTQYSVVASSGIKASLFVGDGSQLTNLPAAGGGATLSGNNTFTGANVFSSSITAGAGASYSTVATYNCLGVNCAVIYSSFTAASSITYTNLVSSYSYTLDCIATWNTSAGNPLIQFNGDAGSHYSYGNNAITSSAGGASVGTASSPTTSARLNGNDNITATSYWILKLFFSAAPGGRNTVAWVGQSDGLVGSNNPESVAIGGVYAGAASLNSMTLSTSAGTLTGYCDLRALVQPMAY